MHRIFDSENRFWYWFGKIADIILLSCLWLLCSLPLLTAGAASIALYDTIAHCVRGPDGDTYSRFFRTFKAELLRGLCITVLWLLLAAILGISFGVLLKMAQESTAAAVYAIAFGVTMLIPAGVLCWLLPLESRFTHKFFDLHKTAVYFTFGHLPTTGIITVLFVACAAAISYYTFLIFCLPATMVCLQSWFIERVFARYIPTEEE